MRFLAIVFALLLAATSRADDALSVFTNQANANLLAQFGFGIANIPIYSSTNSSIRYSAALHYQLQAAANSYDETTPASNYPSVFRPQFAWQGSNLFITGYTNVVLDFDTQYARGFKDISDPTIATNDNVWGVPWVIGAKDNAPAFNEFQFGSIMVGTRKIQLRRVSNPGLPVATNQIYIFSVSNQIAVDAFNNAQLLTKPTLLVASNEASVIFTNNYNWGTNFSVNSGTNELISSWQAGLSQRAAFKTQTLTNFITIPISAWHESKATLAPLSVELPFDTNVFSVHDWQLRTTNRLVYALLDPSSGTNRVLDFVNLAGLGGILDWNTVASVTNALGNSAPTVQELVWLTNGANDSINSAVSAGLSNQIQIGAGLIAAADYPGIPGEGAGPGFDPTIMFRDFLYGTVVPTNVMACPLTPTTMLEQTLNWEPANSKVHYTGDDLTNSLQNQIHFFSVLSPPSFVGSIGRRNPLFQSAKPTNSFVGLTNDAFEMDFIGVPNLPYQIWSSTNLLDWSQLGTALQPSPGIFQFSDPSTNSARYYRVITP